MSQWTHIFGTLRVDPAGATIAQQEYILKTVLAHQPLVTGSEGNMHVNIVTAIHTPATMSLTSASHINMATLGIGEG